MESQPPDTDETIDALHRDLTMGPVWLRVEVSGGGHHAVQLRPGESLEVGSRAGVDVAIEDRAVSGRHCRVAHLGRRVELLDLGSRNGVHLGGARVERATLGVGGSFEVGGSTVRIDAERPLPDHVANAVPLPGLIGSSEGMKRLAAATRRIAQLRVPVLVRGESGTGKDLVARALHSEGGRGAGPFIAMNAAAIATTLAESELFGHEKGAFTGATRDRRGAFREAHKGTLFLDEIGALSVEMQAKLLRVVEEGSVRPVGAEAPVRVDVRLVAATCEPLEAMVAAGRFRGDLFERLAVCVLVAPPLRSRRDDIPALARHLLAASELEGKKLSAAAVARLRELPFPGNVRELRNLVVQAAVRSGRVVEASHVAEVLAERGLAPAALRKITPEHALRAFEAAGGNISAAARNAGVARSSLRDALAIARGAPKRSRR